MVTIVRSRILTDTKDRSLVRARKLIDNAKWLTVFAFTGRACWLVSILLFARAVGPSLFGEFSAYLAFWLIAGRILGLGLEVWVNRQIAISPKENLRTKATALAIRLRLSMVTLGFLLILGVGFFLESIIKYYSLFFLLATRQVVESLREVQVGVLQGRERMKLQTIALIPWDFLQLGVVLWLTWSLTIKNLYLMLVFVFVVSSLGKATTLNLVIRKGMPKWPTMHSISFSEYRRAAKESLFFGLGMLLALSLGRFDVLLLRTFINSQTAGKYSIAALFLEVGNILLGILRQAIFPTLARFSATARSAFVRLTIFSSMGFFAFGIVWAILLALFGPFLLELTGRSFSDAVNILRLLAFSMPLIALASILGNAVTAGGLIKKGVITQICGLICNIVANLVWIPDNGAVGAAYAKFLAYSIITLGYGYLIYGFRKSR